MKRVLLISYVFPPTGGAGVQRALKLVKYLPAFGWEAVVVTPRTPPVPLRDASYARDLPPGLMVRRLPTLELGAGNGGGGGDGGPQPSWRRLAGLAAGLLFPDPRVLWLPTALPGALAAARRQRVDAVLVTGPPFSSFLLAGAVARLARLPLVLDFRDDWSGYFTHGYRRGGGLLRCWLTRTVEGALTARAARVILTTPEAVDRLRSLHGGPAGKYRLLPNGYDPADFAELERHPPSPPNDGRLHLLYTGTVASYHPLGPVWEAVARLRPEQRRRLAITVVGRVVADGETTDPGLPGLSVRLLPYEPHHRVLRRMAGAHALLVTQADHPGLERMVPAKLFEYLAARRPLLAVVPPGSAARIVTGAGAGRAVAPDQTGRLAEMLAGWIERPPQRLGPPPPQYDRRIIAGVMARVLDQAVSAG